MQGSVRAASWPCPAQGGGFSLSPELPQGRAQHAPATAAPLGFVHALRQRLKNTARWDLFMLLRQRLKPTGVSNAIPAAVNSLPVEFQSEGRVLSELPFLATGSISKSSLSIRGSERAAQCWGSTLVMTQSRADFVQFCVPTHMSTDSLLPV